LKLKLHRKEKRELKRFFLATQDKSEYRRALGVLMRAQKNTVTDIPMKLDVSIDAVERWLGSYRKTASRASGRGNHPARLR
jgi:transposase